jgi:nitrogen regulatory protein P-II 1
MAMLAKVEAIIRPERLEAALNALDRFGVIGITVEETRGHGKQRGYTHRYRGAEYSVSLIPKVKMEIVVEDDLADAVADIIMGAARTGEIGDGKIFIYPVREAVRVRTGETGKIAVA